MNIFKVFSQRQRREEQPRPISPMLEAIAIAPSIKTLCTALLCAGLAFGTAIGFSPSIAAAQTASTTRAPSGLALPRFVSLKAGKVNMRIGPGRDYAVDWMYVKPGLPMEIIQEYDNWRRVRDAEGTEGWIHGSLLSGKRTAIAVPWQKNKANTIVLQKEPSRLATTVARIEPGVLGEIVECTGSWCEMEFDGHRGWLEQSLIWGAYPEEKFDQ